jgi:hypothetical protein
MTYSLNKPTGSNGTNPISVLDNAIDTSFYDSTNKLGLQLVGRNAIDYGTAVAQNTIQMTSNFAGTVVPKPTIALQGQLWFNATSGTSGVLYVRKTSSTASQPDQPTDISVNWQKVVTVDGSETGRIPVVNPSGTPQDGDVKVVGSVISMYAAGAWRQIFPAIYS